MLCAIIIYERNRILYYLDERIILFIVRQNGVANLQSSFILYYDTRSRLWTPFAFSFGCWLYISVGLNNLYIGLVAEFTSIVGECSTDYNCIKTVYSRNEYSPYRFAVSVSLHCFIGRPFNMCTYSAENSGVSRSMSSSWIVSHAIERFTEHFFPVIPIDESIYQSAGE